MNRSTSVPRLPSLPSQPPVRFAFASAPKAQLRYLWAALALCAAIIAAKPAYSDSRTDHQNAQDVAHASLQFDDRTDGTVPKTVLPHVKTLLTGWVEYNTKSCAEITPGGWKYSSHPKYGTTATGVVSGRLSSGTCAGHSYLFSAIYYTWTKLKVNGKAPKTDGFSATWTGGKFKEPETFKLTLK